MKRKNIITAIAILVILSIFSFFVLRGTLTGNITGNVVSGENNNNLLENSIAELNNTETIINELEFIPEEKVGCKYKNPECGTNYLCSFSQNKCVRSGGGGGGSSVPLVIDVGGY